MADDYTIANRVGRVIEARVFGLRTADDATRYSRALAAQVLSMPAAPGPVLCADHRPVRIYPQPAADRLVELFQAMNTRLTRIAIIVSESNATFSLQLQRLVREAGYANRRVVSDTGDALAHLSPGLGLDERARIERFLSEA